VENKDYYGYVYLVQDNKTGLVYVGQKKGRVEDSKDYFGSGVIIRHIIKKRGKADLQKIVLELCYSKEELTERETFYKFKYNAFDRLYGYNIAICDTGGDTWTYSSIESQEKRRLASRTSTPNKKHSEEWKRALSAKLKGRKHSKETRKKQSESLKGKNTWTKGIKFSKGHNKAISKTRKNKKLSRGKNNPGYVQIEYQFLINEYFNIVSQKDLVKRYNAVFNTHMCAEGGYKKFLVTLGLPVNTLGRNKPAKMEAYLKFVCENKDRKQWYMDNYEKLEEKYYDSRCEGKTA
jgi:hypothetical protein